MKVSKRKKDKKKIRKRKRKSVDVQDIVSVGFMLYYELNEPSMESNESVKRGGDG